MKYANINTKQVTETLPRIIDATVDPTMEQLNAVGWRTVVAEDAAPEGCYITAQGIAEIDGTTCKLTVVAYSDPATEEAARQAAVVAARQARIDAMPQGLKDAARMFRTILRTYCGPNAETDRSVTYTAILMLYAAKKANPATTTAELTIITADMFILEKLYNSIVAWTGDGTTWSFPWEVLDV